MCLRCKCKITNTTQTIDGDTIFLRRNSNREKPRGGGGKFIITRWFTGITGMYWYFFELEIGWKALKVLFSLEKNVYLY